MKRIIITAAVIALISGCLPKSSNSDGTTDTNLVDTNLAISIDTKGNPVHQINAADSARIKVLRKGFIIIKDEFDVNDNQWLKPIDGPKYVNKNGVYSYFQTNGGVATNLRFVIQYYSDDWLFIQKYMFSIDGEAFEYIPSEVKTDNGDGGMIWEWFDESADENLKTIMKAIANSKSAKIKMVGRQYFDIKTVTSKQKESIKKTLELYKLLGGV